MFRIFLPVVLVADLRKELGDGIFLIFLGLIVLFLGLLRTAGRILKKDLPASTGYLRGQEIGSYIAVGLGGVLVLVGLGGVVAHLLS